MEFNASLGVLGPEPGLFILCHCHKGIFFAGIEMDFNVKDTL